MSSSQDWVTDRQLQCDSDSDSDSEIRRSVTEVPKQPAASMGYHDVLFGKYVPTFQRNLIQCFTHSFLSYPVDWGSKLLRNFRVCLLDYSMLHSRRLKSWLNLSFQIINHLFIKCVIRVKVKWLSSWHELRSWSTVAILSCIVFIITYQFIIKIFCYGIMQVITMNSKYHIAISIVII
jgi:hypothetical protein